MKILKNTIHFTLASTEYNSDLKHDLIKSSKSVNYKNNMYKKLKS